MLKNSSPLQVLPPFFQDTTLINGVIDTPKAASFKLKFDENAGVFRVSKGMPLGFAFPFNFGYVPGTLTDDGDALDVIVLTEHVFPVGAVVLGRLMGVLEATQVEGRRKDRNDRLIVVPLDMRSRNPMVPAVKFDAVLRKAIVTFFMKYNEVQGRKFCPLRYASSGEAVRLVRKAHAAWLGT